MDDTNKTWWSNINYLISEQFIVLTIDRALSHVALYLVYYCVDIIYNP